MRLLSTVWSTATAVLVGLLPSIAWAQQEHPNRATGFRSETLYSSGRDDVNLFNGNLSYSIAIGDPIPVGPGLSLSAQLNYNSKVWSTWTVTGTCGDVETIQEQHADGSERLDSDGPSILAAP
jgi:hypothetical protein